MQIRQPGSTAQRLKHTRWMAAAAAYGGDDWLAPWVDRSRDTSTDMGVPGMEVHCRTGVCIQLPCAAGHASMPAKLCACSHDKHGTKWHL